MKHEVLRHEVAGWDVGPADRLSGTAANVVIRGKIVNSVADEIWVYEVPDRKGRPLRIVVRTNLENVYSGQRRVREVYEQAVISTWVRPGDWLEGEAPQPPKPGAKPVNVGDRVSAMPDGYSLGAGLVTAIEWKQRNLQPPYDKPPTWYWEWRVTVWFGGEQTREGRWHTDWVDKPEALLRRTQEDFEPLWQKLEAEFAKRQAGQ